MTPPAVVRAASICRVGSAKIRGSEGGDLRRDPELDRSRVKCVQPLAQLRKEIGLAGQLIAVGVVAAHRAKENLTVHAQVGSGGNQLRDHAQLLAETRRRENGLKRGKACQG